MPVLDSIMRAPKPLVIVAESVEGTALQMLVHDHVDRSSSTSRSGAGLGEKRIHLLEDMAALTGAPVHPGRRCSRWTRSPARTSARPNQYRVTSEDDDHRGARRPSARERRLAQLHAELERATIGTDQDSCPNGWRACRDGGRHQGRSPRNAEAGGPPPGGRRAAGHPGRHGRGHPRRRGSALLHAEPALSDLDVHGYTGPAWRSCRRPDRAAGPDRGQRRVQRREVVKQVASMAVDEGWTPCRAVSAT